jgi:hypothetical protein
MSHQRLALAFLYSLFSPTMGISFRDFGFQDFKIHFNLLGLSFWILGILEFQFRITAFKIILLGSELQQ